MGEARKTQIVFPKDALSTARGGKLSGMLHLCWQRQRGPDPGSRLQLHLLPEQTFTLRMRKRSLSKKSQHSEVPHYSCPARRGQDGFFRLSEVLIAHLDLQHRSTVIKFVNFQHLTCN